MPTFVETFKIAAQDISTRLLLFDENDLEQVDEAYVDEFTQTLRLLVTDIVASEFRILPVHELYELRDVVKLLPDLFTNVCDKITMKIKDLSRENEHEKEILLYQGKDNLVNLNQLLSKLELKIIDHLLSLTNGKFFLSLEMVWGSIEFFYLFRKKSDLLKRTRHVTITSNSNPYERTVTKAVLSNAECAAKSHRSNTSSADYDVMLDIFGGRNADSASAHLTPHSTSCVNLNYDLAKKCLHGVIVKEETATVVSASTTKASPEATFTRKKEPPKTCTSTDKNMNVARKRPYNDDDDDDDNYINPENLKAIEYNKEKNSSDEEYLSDRKDRKPASGDKENHDGSDSNKKPASVPTFEKTNTSGDRRQVDGSYLYSVADNPRKHVTITSKNNDGEDFGDASTKTSAGRRLSNVGIKHFRTNRIKLCSQAKYLDANPCLLIVPVLTPEQVANWDGSGYSAIVLAGAEMQTNAQVASNPASYVYERVRAGYGSTSGEFLATSGDLLIATELLRYTVCATAASSRKAYNKELRNKAQELKMEVAAKRDTQKAYNKILKLKPEPSIPVPFIKDEYLRVQSEVLHIRKITFTAINNRSETSQYHYAPDPALLVAKAASNWLKRQDNELLPGCDLYNDDTVSDINSESQEGVINDDNDLISFSQEAKLRGWSVTYKKIPDEIALPEGTVTIMDDNDCLFDCDED